MLDKHSSAQGAVDLYEKDLSRHQKEDKDSDVESDSDAGRSRSRRRGRRVRKMSDAVLSNAPSLMHGGGMEGEENSDVEDESLLLDRGSNDCRARRERREGDRRGVNRAKSTDMEHMVRPRSPMKGVNRAKSSDLDNMVPRTPTTGVSRRSLGSSGMALSPTGRRMYRRPSTRVTLSPMKQRSPKTPTETDSKVILQFDPTNSSSYRCERIAAKDVLVDVASPEESKEVKAVKRKTKNGVANPSEVKSKSRSKHPDEGKAKGRTKNIVAKYDESSEEESDNANYLRGVKQFAVPDQQQDPVSDFGESLSSIATENSTLGDDEEGSTRGSPRRRRSTKPLARHSSIRKGEKSPSTVSKVDKHLEGSKHDVHNKSQAREEIHDVEDDLDESTSSMHESFRRRGRRRTTTATARGRIPTERAARPAAGIQFQPQGGSVRRQSMAGEIAHTPYDDMLSEFETSDGESEHEVKRERERIRVEIPEDFNNLQADPKAHAHSRLGAEFEKAHQAAASALEGGGKKEKKRLGGISRYFGKKKNDDADTESVHSRSSSRDSQRVSRGPMKHSLLLDDESSVSKDSDHF